MHKFFSVITVLGFLAATPAFAQSTAPLPELPEPIQNLVSEGAQIRYLGKDNNMDAWLTVKGGVEQYFYVLPDRSAFLMGVMFDKTGKLVTAQQVKRLQDNGDDLLDTLTEFPEAEESKVNKPFDYKTPAEQMFSDVEKSNWVILGQANAPVMYAFVDPQCAHCHAFINELLEGKYFEDGKIQLRIIPVGFKEETRAQAAFLIATPNPQERWFKHMAGDADALPAKREINQQGVQRNLAIMQSWKFDATPMAVYRGKDGSVKLIRGRPKKLTGVIADIGATK